MKTLCIYSFIAICSLTIAFGQTRQDFIYLKSGDIYKGQIIKDVPGEYIQIEMKDGTIKKVKYEDIEKREVEQKAEVNMKQTENSRLSELLKKKATEYPKTGSLGFGIGIPFGTLGINGEYLFNDILGLNLGLGYAVYDIGYSIGGRVYLNPRSSNFRGMFDIYYGVNGVIVNTEKTYTGFNLGFGFKWMFGESKTSGLELEGIYILSSKMNDEIDNLKTSGYSVQDYSRFKISLGYRYGF